MNTSARVTPGQRFVVSHYDEKDFTSTSPRAYLLKRDLGVREATGGLATVHVVRAVRPCEPETLPAMAREALGRERLRGPRDTRVPRRAVRRAEQRK